MLSLTKGGYLAIFKYSFKWKDRINPFNFNYQFLEQEVGVVIASNSDKWGLCCLEFSVSGVSFIDLWPLIYPYSFFSFSHSIWPNFGHLCPLQIGLVFLAWPHESLKEWDVPGLPCIFLDPNLESIVSLRSPGPSNAECF